MRVRGSAHSKRMLRWRHDGLRAAGFTRFRRAALDTRLAVGGTLLARPTFFTLLIVEGSAAVVTWVTAQIALAFPFHAKVVPTRR